MSSDSGTQTATAARIFGGLWASGCPSSASSSTLCPSHFSRCTACPCTWVHTVLRSETRSPWPSGILPSFKAQLQCHCVPEDLRVPGTQGSPLPLPVPQSFLGFPGFWVPGPGSLLLRRWGGAALTQRAGARSCQPHRPQPSCAMRDDQ